MGNKAFVSNENQTTTKQGSGLIIDVVYQRPLRQVVLNCIRLCKLRITVPSIVNEAKHKIIIILLAVFLIWCLFTIVTIMTTNEKQSKTISSYK